MVVETNGGPRTASRSDDEVTQRIEPETLAECARWHREQLAQQGLCTHEVTRG